MTLYPEPPRLVLWLRSSARKKHASRATMRRMFRVAREEDGAGQPRATSPASRFARGLSLGLPIFLGYLPVGLAFGVLAERIGFTTFQAVVCSATALAGAGQFIALSLLSTGSSAMAAVIATGVVNLRYVLFSTTISPYLAGVSPWKQAILAFTLTDETFAVNVADRRRGMSTVASMAGVGAVAWAGWVLGTLLGAVGSDWIGDPRRWGMDFAMPAMFSALFVALAENRRHVIVGCLSAATVLLIPLVTRDAVDTSWAIVLSSLAGATIASVVFKHA